MTQAGNQPLAQAALDEVEQAGKLIDQISTHMTQASDLAELGAFSSMFAHEVNNLMTQVGGRAQLALLHLDQPEKTIQALEIARRASVQIAQLSEMFMQASNEPNQGMPKHAQPDPFTAIHERTLGFLSDQDIATLGFKISGHTNLIPSTPAVLLEQVLLNLYLNSIRAVEESASDGGRVSITVESDLDAPQCSTWNNLNNSNISSWARIVIEDTGIGMTQEQLAGLFKSKSLNNINIHNAQPPAAKSGHGLGLAICHRFLTNARCTIEAESTLGEGTKITITVPCSVNQAVA